MQSDILQKMSLDELRDLFLVTVTEFMKLTEQRDADGYRIRDLKVDIEAIQEEINLKKILAGIGSK